MVARASLLGEDGYPTEQARPSEGLFSAEHIEFEIRSRRGFTLKPPVMYTVRRKLRIWDYGNRRSSPKESLAEVTKSFDEFLTQCSPPSMRPMTIAYYTAEPESGS
jgi:hypothetical protein